MTRIGYARVTTTEQIARFADRLKAAGCQQVHVDTATGALADRPELATALAALHDGDQLIVCQLDHPARSLQHLIGLIADLLGRGVEFTSLAEGIDTTNAEHRHTLTALARCHKTLASERTLPGRKAAKAKGARKGGRPRKLSADELAQARAMLDAGNHTMLDIAKSLGVSRGTLYRYLNPNN